ncbi:MAG: YolD-like family protein [Tenericutes bacterium]|nr:YolD-like family protein [Mycoplasmatota bacterium]
MLNTYRDRGIIKWAAFDALSGFNPMLREMKHRLNKTKKPILSEDDFTNMNFALQEAILDEKEIAITYFEAGYSKITFGYVKKLDYNTKIITLSTTEKINAFDILSIQVI